MPLAHPAKAIGDDASESAPRYERARNAVLSILKTFPQDEVGWAERGPQSEADVAAFFGALTLSHIPHQTRKIMPCRYLLEIFVQHMPLPHCPLFGLTLAAACTVAMGDGQLTYHEAVEILADIFPRPDSDLTVQRAAVAQHVRFLDVLKQFDVLGARVYEIPSRCIKPWLDRFASFTMRHFDFLEVILRKGEAATYKPKLQFDSGCLRIQHVIYNLFAGRFSRFHIEMHLLKRGTEGLPQDPRPVKMSAPPESIPTTHHSSPVHKFLPLDDKYEALRKAASSDLVGLAATFRRKPRQLVYSSLDVWPELSHIVQAQEQSITSLVEETGKRIVDINWHEGLGPRIIRVTQSIGSVVPEGFMGFAILLNNTPMSMAFGDQVVKWEPGHMMCFRGEAPKVLEATRQFFFLLILLEIESM
ncbi:hypothetical protein BGZ63DRAFT_401422 [Mariannaea sp. PMI_226]|nr:hypothetical protein BGZ63DRAFT_401422 [Mariannaea sp. PMI_226]